MKCLQKSQTNMELNRKKVEEMGKENEQLIKYIELLQRESQGLESRI